jgi:hypothetical protein
MRPEDWRRLKRRWAVHVAGLYAAALSGLATGQVHLFFHL